MLQRSCRIITDFVRTSGKAAWLEDRVAWKLFQWRQQRQDRVNAAFDVRYGTDTAMEIALTNAGVGADAAERGNSVYRALWEKKFHATIQSIDQKLGNLQDYTFIDIGSGKGKLLLLASLYPFRRIIGIEYAPGLHATAIANVACFSEPLQRCRAIEPRLGDALELTLPAGPVIALIFNAFDRPTTQRVLAGLVRQRSSVGGPLFVVYENVRRAAEIGEAFAVPHAWQMIAETRHRIIIGNEEAARLWHGGRVSTGTAVALAPLVSSVPAG
jgi:hypothetical protein